MNRLFTRSILFFIVFLGLMAEPAAAQEPATSIAITGTIINEEGEPIPGATVLVKGNDRLGVATNSMGEYKLTVPSDATIVVTFLGYNDTTFEVTPDKSDYTTTLYQASQRVNDVVIVGYGELKKSDLTGSVSVIGERSFHDQPVKNVADVLQGRTAGVEVTTSSGMPGAGARVRVRGTTSINKSSDPLYVIDGIISSSGLDGINPQDIASMQILKDASSTAVYGSRGANGVVLITTRTGEKGTSRIYFDSKIGISEVRKNYDLMNAYEYALALNDIKGSNTISPADLELYRTGEKGINWIDLLTRTGITQNYNIGATGGSDKIRYMVSGNVLDQQAVTIKSKYMRYGIRANIDADVRPWLSISTKINGSVLHQKNGAPNWFHVLNFSPTMEMKDSETGIYNNDPYNIGTLVRHTQLSAL